MLLCSHVYEEVEQQGIKTWSFYRYSLTKEYEKKPPLAPPLIVINLIWRTITCWFECDQCKQCLKCTSFYACKKCNCSCSLCCVSHTYSTQMPRFASTKKPRRLWRDLTNWIAKCAGHLKAPSWCEIVETYIIAHFTPDIWPSVSDANVGNEDPESLQLPQFERAGVDRYLRTKRFGQKMDKIHNDTDVLLHRYILMYTTES